MKGYKTLTLIKVKLFLREPLAFFFTLIFPLLLLLMYGVIWGNEPDPEFFGRPVGYIDVAVPGLMAMIIGTVGLMNLPAAVATDREQKILRRYRATPLRPITYLAAEVTVYLALTVAGMALLFGVGTVLYDLQFAANLPGVFVALVLGTLAFVAGGYVIAGLAPTARVAQVVGQVLFFPMFLLSGAALPQELMPVAVQEASQWLPLTHMVRLLQDLWFGGQFNLVAMVVLAGLMLGGTVVSVRTFRWE